MFVKCGRREFELTKEDEIMYNGACYQIITQKYSQGMYDNLAPKISKTKAKKMIKDGVLVLDRVEESMGMTLHYYRINDAI